ncbi:MAG: hypothetical protein ACI9NC_000545 [Verrucomicrobiales bacterium]|jgi:hypothetical protein
MPTHHHQSKNMSNSNKPNTDLLKVLTREGVLINVSVRYWRANKKLNAQDLGLDPDDVSDRLISLGHKRLLPREATSRLNLIESRTHAFIETNTFPFLGGIAKFLPNPKLAEVQAKLAEFESEFADAREAFIDSYAANRGEALEEWQVMATRLAADPRALMAAIADAFPAASRLQKKFAFDVQMFQIAAPANLSRELIEAGEQEQVIEARRAAASEARVRIQSDATAFVAECVTDLRQQTAQLCDEMLNSMQRGKTDGVHQKTLNRLVRFIDQFKAMNFADDREMEQRLEQVRSEFLERSAGDYRNNPAAQRDLQSGLTTMRDHANGLLEQDAKELVERFGQMGRRKLQLAG